MRTGKRVFLPGTLMLGALVMAAAAPRAWAGHEVVELSEARVFFEENTTDEDLGFHFKADGQAWKRMLLFGPHGKLLLNAGVHGKLAKVGLTEIFSESAEPGHAVIPREEFIAKFPEGEYTFIGITIDHKWLVGETTLTHDIPEGAELVSPAEDAVVDPDADLLIEWETVEDPDPPDSVIEFYEVIVEKDEDDELLRVFSVHMLPTDTSVRVPEEFLEPGKAYKVEIISQETSDNRSSIEVDFSTAD